MLDMLNVEYVCVYCQLENKKKPQKNFPDEDVLILCTEVPGIEREQWTDLELEIYDLLDKFNQELKYEKEETFTEQAGALLGIAKNYALFRQLRLQLEDIKD